VTRRRAFAALACAAAAAGVAAGAAVSDPTRSQTFFRDHLLDDRRTAAPIKQALRDGSAFVDRRITFADLTSDGKQDAVVRVQSGGAAGAIGVYVFSTDGAKSLRPVHRAQKLRRASTRVSEGVLTYRSAAYEDGDELCCPTELAETELRWDRRDDRLVVEERRDVDGP
jgi:hypothetical protein